MLYTQVLINDNWSGSLMYDAGNLSSSDNLEGWGEEGGVVGSSERGDTGMPMADSR